MKIFRRTLFVVMLIAIIVLSFLAFGPKDVAGEKQTIDSATVKMGLENIAELATEEYWYTSVESFENQLTVFKEYNVPLTKKSFILKCSGVVKAGINFGEIEVCVDDEAMQINVSLPQAKILSNEIDHNSYMVLDEHNNLFNPITPEDSGAIEKTLTEKAEKDAIASGILTKAEDQAKEIIVSFMNQYVVSMGYEVIIK